MLLLEKGAGKLTERWDLFDDALRPTGEVHARGGEVPPGRFHMAVHVHLYDGRGGMLLQQRAASKPKLPGAWLMVGGSALSGEGGRRAAVREVREEMGIELSEEALEPLFIERRAHSFVLVYAAQTDARAESCRLDEAEVQAAAVMPVEEALWRMGGLYPPELEELLGAWARKYAAGAGNEASASNRKTDDERNIGMDG